MYETELTDVEKVALNYKLNKAFKNEEGTPVPFTQALIDSLSEFVFDDIPKERISSLQKFADELDLLTLYLLHILNDFTNNAPKHKDLNDDEVIKLALKFATFDGIIQILASLRAGVESRLMDIRNGIDRTTGGFNGKLN